MNTSQAGGWLDHPACLNRWYFNPSCNCKACKRVHTKEKNQLDWYTISLCAGRQKAVIAYHRDRVFNFWEWYRPCEGWEISHQAELEPRTDVQHGREQRGTLSVECWSKVGKHFAPCHIRRKVTSLFSRSRGLSKKRQSPMRARLGGGGGGLMSGD